MMLKLCCIAIVTLLFVEVKGQLCTCNALDDCWKPLKDCKTECKSKLTTTGASACLDQEELAMDAVKKCRCNGNGRAQLAFDQAPPFPGPPPLPGRPGPLGPNLQGSAKVELTAFGNCMKDCTSRTLTTSPFQCEKDHNCPPPNFNCKSRMNSTLVCTCFQKAYGVNNVPECPQSPQ